MGVGPHRQPSVGFHLRRGNARLQILRMDHLGFVNFLDYEIGFGHRLVGIADMDDSVAADVLHPSRSGFRQRHIFVQHRRVWFGRFLGVERHRQRLVGDFDFFERLLGDGQSIGGDGGDRVAHEAHFAARENVAVDVAAAIAHVGGIFSGNHGVDAGDFLRFAGVDADNFRVGVLAAQYRALQLVFEHQVDAVNALADDAVDAAHSGRAGADDFEFSFCHD